VFYNAHRNLRGRLIPSHDQLQKVTGNGVTGKMMWQSACLVWKTSFLHTYIYSENT